MSVRVETMRGYAHPWLCDVMGHLNSRHIFALFDDATFQLFALLDYPFAEQQKSGLGWADVHLEIDLSHEVPAGTALVVRTGIVKLGTKSFTCCHELFTAYSEVLHARMTAVIACFDLTARRAAPLPNAFRERAQPYMTDPSAG
jgi:acyl-CoA thioester hydrolase